MSSFLLAVALMLSAPTGEPTGHNGWDPSSDRILPPVTKSHGLFFTPALQGNMIPPSPALLSARPVDAKSFFRPWDVPEDCDPCRMEFNIVMQNMDTSGYSWYNEKEEALTTANPLGFTDPPGTNQIDMGEIGLISKDYPFPVVFSIEDTVFHENRSANGTCTKTGPNCLFNTPCQGSLYFYFSVISGYSFAAADGMTLTTDPVYHNKADTGASSRNCGNGSPTAWIVAGTVKIYEGTHPDTRTQIAYVSVLLRCDGCTP